MRLVYLLFGFVIPCPVIHPDLLQLSFPEGGVWIRAKKSEQRRISDPAVMYTSPGSLCYSDNAAPATLFSGIIYKQNLREGLMLSEKDGVAF